MIKKHALFIITLGLSVFIGGLAFAQSCPDVVGDWEVTGEQVLGQWRPGEDPSFVYSYQSLDGVIVIVDQQGCLFYGNIYLGSFIFPMVGNINNRNITMVSGDAVINAKLRGYDRETRLFTTMNITAFDIIDDLLEIPPDDTFMSCAQGTAIRK